jgi:hypothetical protein
MKRALLLTTIVAFSSLLSGCPGSLVSHNLNPKDLVVGINYVLSATEAKIINGEKIVMPIQTTMTRSGYYGGKTKHEVQEFIKLWNSAPRASYKTILPIGSLRWREGIDVKEIDIGILGISSDGENVTYEISSPDFSLSELPPIITKVQLTAKVFNSCKGIQTGVYRPCYVLTFDVEKYGDEWKYL